MKSTKLLAIAAVVLIAAGCSDTNNYYYGEGGENNGEEKPVVIDKTENTEARCSDGIDNDNSGKADCEDPNCAAFSFCAKAEEGKENTLDACKDGVDNDGDGKKDCEDEDCQAFAICALSEDENTADRCQDGLDNDKDGKIDCDDDECKLFSFCSVSSDKLENTLAACTDGIDNDKDGDLDCIDRDCQVFDICKELISVVENTRELCSDGIDNDFNGLADDKDPSCEVILKGGGAYGETYDSCKDKLDVDGDGKKGCDDPECAIYDVCMGMGSTDECPDDPFKYQSDSCACGETKVGEDCYKNIVTADDLYNVTGQDKYIIKQPINLGETDHAPIAGFGGVLDGGNYRISGVMNQKAFICEKGRCESAASSRNGYCGLFASVGTNAVFKNIDIATTLNCSNDDNPQGTNVYVGGLAGEFRGSVEHVTGSSKVYLQEVNSDVIKVYETMMNRYVGGIFGFVGKTSGDEIAVMEDMHVKGNVSLKLHSNIVDYDLTNKKDISIFFNTRVGGIAGGIYSDVTLKNVESDIHLTSKRSNGADYYYDKANYKYYYPNVYHYEMYGGIAGYTSDLISHAVSRGNIDVELLSDNSGRITTVYRKIGGIVGQAAMGVTDSQFLGRLNVYGSLKDVVASSTGEGSVLKIFIDEKGEIAEQGTYVGGIAGVAPDSIDRCVVDAEMNLLASNTAAGGIAGWLVYNPLTDKANYIQNCSSRVDLTLGSRTDGTTNSRSSYWGGIVGYAGVKSGRQYEHNENGEVDKDNTKDLVIPNGFNRKAYLINNSAQTTYYENTNLPYTQSYYSGISGEGGIIVNNVVSDHFVCPESGCYYRPKAVGGDYVYESYWNKDTQGSSSGAADYTDASAEPYTFNIQGVPVTRTNKTILGLLRYNAGYDGGVLSANIPANNGQYADWTTASDRDGHVIPVPNVNNK